MSSKTTESTTLFIIFRDDSKNRRERRGTKERNNNPLRSSASFAVNLFCNDPFIRNKLKSHSKSMAKLIFSLSENIPKKTQSVFIRVDLWLKAIQIRDNICVNL